MNYYCTLFLATLLLPSLNAAENNPSKKRKLETSEEFFLPIKKQKTEGHLLLLAIKAKKPDLLEKVVEISSNLNEEIDFNATPLIYATEQDDIDAVKILAEHGADINCAINGHYPLQTAAMLNRSIIAHYLLDRGANPNIQTRHGLPLVWAIEHKNASLAERLLKQGADAKIDEEKCSSIIRHTRKHNKDGTLDNVMTLLKQKQDSLTLWDTLLDLVNQYDKEK